MAQANDHRYPARTAVSAGSPIPKETSIESRLKRTALPKLLRMPTTDGAASTSSERRRGPLATRSRLLPPSSGACFPSFPTFPGVFLRNSLIPSQRTTMLLVIDLLAIEASTVRLNGIRRTAANRAKRTRTTIASISRDKCDRLFPG